MVRHSSPQSSQLIDDGETEILTVHELFRSGTKMWNQSLLEQIIRHEDVLEILKIRLGTTKFKDRIGWHYTSSRTYTVKSGYWLSTHLPDQEYIPPPAGSPIIKEAIWKLHTALKMRHFL